jgi:hypothetical protein
VILIFYIIFISITIYDRFIVKEQLYFIWLDHYIKLFIILIILYLIPFIYNRFITYLMMKYKNNW